MQDVDFLANSFDVVLRGTEYTRRVKKVAVDGVRGQAMNDLAKARGSYPVVALTGSGHSPVMARKAGKDAGAATGSRRCCYGVLVTTTLAARLTCW